VIDLVQGTDIEALGALLRDYGGKAVVALAAVVLCWRVLEAYLRRTVGGLVDVSVGKELAAYTEELRQLNSLQRRQFELYTGGQHRAYPELYRHLKKAEGMLLRIGAVTEPPNFDTATDSELQSYGEYGGIDRDRLAAIVALRTTDRRAMERQFQAAVTERKRVRGRQAYFRANNYLALNELYLSDSVLTGARAVLERMDGYERLERDPDGKRTEMLDLAEQIRANLLALRGVMQAELRAGEGVTRPH
jgi:hypothetical protein